VDRNAHLQLAVALGNRPALVMLGEPVAARLMSFAAHSGNQHRPPSADDVATTKDVRKRVAKRLGVARTAALWAQGAQLSLAEAVHLALTGRG
jgi:hypothetical protein